MPFAEVGELSMYYEVRGEGPPLLYIGGTGGDLRKQPNVFDSPLGDVFRILAFDQRGLGQTSRPESDYTMQDYADDCAGLVDGLDWPPSPVLGVSFGGMVAQELALRHPDKVTRLVLPCTSSGGAGGASYPLHEIRDLPERERIIRHLTAADTRCSPHWQREHPEEFDALIERARQGSQGTRDDPEAEAGQVRQLLARAGHDTYERLIAIHQPTLIQGGIYDGVAPIENARALERQIPDATLEFYEGGHGFLGQDPKAYVDMIEWLGSADDQ